VSAVQLTRRSKRGTGVSPVLVEATCPIRAICGKTNSRRAGISMLPAENASAARRDFSKLRPILVFEHPRRTGETPVPRLAPPFAPANW